MVERLKQAIDKARTQRARVLGEEAAVPAPVRQDQAVTTGVGALWDALEPAELSPDLLRAHRIVAFSKTDPFHVSIDILRARVFKVCRDQGWRRIGISSAKGGSGKSFLSANLALSLSRYPSCRVVLIDADMKRPSQFRILGVNPKPEALRDFLNGRVPARDFLTRLNGNLAVGLNKDQIVDSAELLQSDNAKAALQSVIDEMAPQFVLYDLPPLLVNDDAMALLPNIDALILVAAANETTATDIEKCERAIEGAVNFLGVVLNKDLSGAESSYDYDYSTS